MRYYCNICKKDITKAEFLYSIDIFDNNLVERLHGTIQEWNKTQRELKDEYSAFIRGHQVYYNYIRPHQSLFGYTPANLANIDLKIGENKWNDLLNIFLKNENNKR